MQYLIINDSREMLSDLHLKNDNLYQISCLLKRMSKIYENFVPNSGSLP